MKSADQIVAFLAHRIGHILHRPLMYEGTADGVECLLFNYLEIWSVITGCEEEYPELLSQTAPQDVRSLADQYRSTHANATEDETVRHIVTVFRRVSNKLGVAVPYEQIERELSRTQM